MTFQLPPLRRYYTTKPDHYISHLVGHEGPGSLLSALKARGWVTDLCAGVEDDGYGANSCCYLFRCGAAWWHATVLFDVCGCACGPATDKGVALLRKSTLTLMRIQAPCRLLSARHCVTLRARSVAMTLTEAGLHAGPGLGLAPVALLFQYMRLLQEAGEGVQERLQGGGVRSRGVVVSAGRP